MAGSSNGDVIRVFPNPCREYYILEYYFKTTPKNAYYEVADALGKIIEKGQFDNQQDQIVIRTSAYGTGLYTIRFFVNGKFDKALKINVIK